MYLLQSIDKLYLDDRSVSSDPRLDYCILILPVPKRWSFRMKFKYGLILSISFLFRHNQRAGSIVSACTTTCFPPSVIHSLFQISACHLTWVAMFYMILYSQDDLQLKSEYNSPDHMESSHKSDFQTKNHL